jgi:hypothetical protein
MQPWYSLARDRLRELRQDPRGWGYCVRDIPYPEPTALACLALLAVEGEPVPLDTLELIDASAEWLVDIQQADGAVGVAERLPSLCWPTACAALLWSQLPTYQRPLASALRWLQQCEQSTQYTSTDRILGRRARRGAWPWIEATRSWLEPAGMAILALCRNQLVGHQLIADGVRWILARSVTNGGWHQDTTMGAVPARPPQVEPTGISLLALRAAGLTETQEVTRACHYLQCVLPHSSTPEALGWGLLGYLAWRPRPLDAPQWLSRAYAEAAGVADAPVGLALLILADRPGTLSLLGVSPALQEVPPELPFVPELLGV